MNTLTTKVMTYRISCFSSLRSTLFFSILLLFVCHARLYAASFFPYPEAFFEKEIELLPEDEYPEEVTRNPHIHLVSFSVKGSEIYSEDYISPDVYHFNISYKLKNDSWKGYTFRMGICYFDKDKKRTLPNLGSTRGIRSHYISRKNTLKNHVGTTEGSHNIPKNKVKYVALRTFDEKKISFREDFYRSIQKNVTLIPMKIKIVIIMVTVVIISIFSLAVFFLIRYYKRWAKKQKPKSKTSQKSRNPNKKSDKSPNSV